MKIGDAITVAPYGGTRHVGLITTITENIAYCDEWYSLGIPNCVEGEGFHKNILKVVDKELFVEAKKKWENRPEPITEE